MKLRLYVTLTPLPPWCGGKSVRCSSGSESAKSRASQRGFRSSDAVLDRHLLQPLSKSNEKQTIAEKIDDSPSHQPSLLGHGPTQPPCFIFVPAEYRWPIFVLPKIPNLYRLPASYSISDHSKSDCAPKKVAQGRALRLL